MLSMTVFISRRYRIPRWFFPNAPQKGSRFKVRVQGLWRRREVLAFMSAKRSQASASVGASLFTLSVPKVSTVTGIGGVVVAKRRTVVTFGLASGERKGERREEKREMRGERIEQGRERGEERQVRT